MLIGTNIFCQIKRFITRPQSRSYPQRFTITSGRKKKREAQREKEREKMKADFNLLDIKVSKLRENALLELFKYALKQLGIDKLCIRKL